MAINQVLGKATRDALFRAADGLSHGVVVVSGFPAAGKSSVSRWLASQSGALVLDKDSFASDLEQAVMSELTGNPHDRGSAIYRRVVGPHVYQALVKNALMIGQHHLVVVDAPFIEYVRTAAREGVSLGTYIKTKANSATETRTVWIHAAADEIQKRMIRRGAERDQPKLMDWPTYRAEVLDSGISVVARKVVDSVVMN
ncbi:AAA family ATPase [Nocardia sp. NPDC101769]|uniref:AAA family ATPase n=1 Tax=Nocardia sp. NPDC101769 TaxID=3364333 RepID=UPI00382C2C0F